MDDVDAARSNLVDWDIVVWGWEYTWERGTAGIRLSCEILVRSSTWATVKMTFYYANSEDQEDPHRYEDCCRKLKVMVGGVVDKLIPDCPFSREDTRDVGGRRLSRYYWGAIRPYH